MNGLLYVVIIGLWAAYLVPRWVARHELRSEERNAERFSRAMRVLSRRSPAGHGEVPESGPSRGATSSTEAPDQSSPLAPAASQTPATARARLAARRRRTLLGLFVGLVLTAVLVPFTPLPVWTLLVAGGVLAAYVVHLRNQVRQSAALRRNRGVAARSAQARRRRTSSVERMVASRRTMTAERRAAQERAREHAEAEEASAQAARRALEEAAWQPLPVPLPTYVTKPKAVRPTRVIDLTRAGAWAMDVDRAADGAPQVDGAAERDRTDAQVQPAVGEETTIELGGSIHRRAVGD